MMVVIGWIGSSLVPLLLGISTLDETEPTLETATDLNAAILQYAQRQRGHRVGDGQCSDLVRAAFEATGAGRVIDEEGRSAWGRKVESVDQVRPGDILVFRGVLLTGRRMLPNGAALTYRIEAGNHVAIITGLEQRGGRIQFRVLHQNAGWADANPKRRQQVQSWSFILDQIRRGTISAYRPQPSAVRVRSSRIGTGPGRRR